MCVRARARACAHVRVCVCERAPARLAVCMCVRAHTRDAALRAATPTPQVARVGGVGWRVHSLDRGRVMGYVAY